MTIIVACQCISGKFKVLLQFIFKQICTHWETLEEKTYFFAFSTTVRTKLDVFCSVNVVLVQNYEY
jgi:hypothetical protein